MILVTIQYVPHGDLSQAQVIGTARIINDGTGTERSGNYRCRFRDHAGEELWSTVRGFARQRYNAWSLLRLALDNALAAGAWRMPDGAAERRRAGAERHPDRHEEG